MGRRFRASRFRHITQGTDGSFSASGSNTFTISLTGVQAANYIDIKGEATLLSRGPLRQKLFTSGAGFQYCVDKASVSYSFFQNN